MSVDLNDVLLLCVTSQMHKLQDISLRDMCVSSAGGDHSEIGELLPSECVCVCVCVCVCMCMRVYAFVHACIHTCACACVYVHVCYKIYIHSILYWLT